MYSPLVYVLTFFPSPENSTLLFKSYIQKGTYMPVMFLILSAVINPFGVNRPFLHHFLNARCASSLLIVNGITFLGANFPVNLSADTTTASQNLHDVAVVSASVITIAPQFSQ